MCAVGQGERACACQVSYAHSTIPTALSIDSQWLRRVSYSGHSKLPTITKVVNGLLQRLKAAPQQQGVTVLIKGCNGKKNQPCHHCIVQCRQRADVSFTCFKINFFQDLNPKFFFGVNNEWDQLQPGDNNIQLRHCYCGEFLSPLVFCLPINFCQENIST